MRIAIVGAGVIGVQSAHALLDQGHHVVLIDPDGIGQRASKGNAGGIVHTDIMPLASPKAWRHIPQWLFDPIGPFSIRPTYAPAILPWLFRFICASTPKNVERSVSALIDLNGNSLPAWEARLQRLGLAEKHLRRNGYACVFGRMSDFDAALPVIRRQESLGYSVEVLRNYAAVKKLEPALGPAAVAAVNYPGGVNVDDPAGLVLALGKAAVERGADHIKDEVVFIRPLSGGVSIGLQSGQTLEADMAVIAAGAWSKPLCTMLGDHVPLDTERGYNLTLPKGSFGLSRMILFEGQGFVTTPLDIGDRIGGAVEFGGLSLAPNFARVDAMITRAKRFLPEARFEGGTRWMGFRPSLPDSLPVIGPSKKSARIFYAFGHAHHGLTQSALTGDIIGALVAGKPPPINVGHFSAGRF